MFIKLKKKELFAAYFLCLFKVLKCCFAFLAVTSQAECGSGWIVWIEKKYQVFARKCGWLNVDVYFHV